MEDLKEKYGGSKIGGVLREINDIISKSNIEVNDKKIIADHFNNVIKVVKEMSKEKAINLSKLVKKPSIFDGIEPNPRQWLEMYEFCAELNAWEEETKAKYFPAFLEKSAFDWYKTEIKGKGLSFIQIKTEFVNVYYSEASNAKLGRDIDQRFHKHDEPVNVFISEMDGAWFIYQAQSVAPKVHRNKVGTE